MGLTLEPRIVEWLIEQTGRAHPHDEPPAVCGACAVYNYLSEKWRIARLSRPSDDLDQRAAIDYAVHLMEEAFEGAAPAHAVAIRRHIEVITSLSEQPAPPHRDYAGRTCTDGLMHSHSEQPAPPLDVARQACIDIMLMTVDHLDDRRLRLIHKAAQRGADPEARLGSAPSTDTETP